jgi:hypothetical protein
VQGRFAQENYITPEQEATLRRRALDILRGMTFIVLHPIALHCTRQHSDIFWLSLVFANIV